VTVERTGEAFELDARLTVVGRRLQPGDAAPDFALDYLDPADSNIRTIRLTDTAGQVRLLNVVNSLDTPVCQVETRRWEVERPTLPSAIQLYTISMDLPYAQARWQSAEDVNHVALSAHRDEAFGRDYGVLIKEWRLLQRAVFVVDRDNRIVHAEYVADQMAEPNYNAALAVVKQAAARV
jgi:thiol peroxidase